MLPDPFFLCVCEYLTGISGKVPGAGDSSEAPASSGGAFARMSDVIPPLPAPQQAAADDEDDWEA